MGYSLKKKVTLGKKSHTWKNGSHFGKRLTIAKKKRHTWKKHDGTQGAFYCKYRREMVGNFPSIPYILSLGFFVLRSGKLHNLF